MKSKTPERKLFLNIENQKSLDKLSVTSGLTEKKKEKTLGKIEKIVKEAMEIKQKKMCEIRKINKIKRELELKMQLQEELQNAAVLIQKHARGYIARKKVVSMMIEKLKYENYLMEVSREIENFCGMHDSVKHMAAYRIQRYWKGFRKYPMKIPILKRLLRRKLAEIEINSLKEEKKKKISKIKELERIYKANKLKNCLERLKSLCEDHSEIEEIEGNDDISITEVLIETESSRKESLNQYSEIIQEKNLEPEKEKIKIIEDKPLIKPKNFILSEANFYRPTVAYNYKKQSNSEIKSSSKPPKPKCKKKSKKYLKQVSTKPSLLRESYQETKKLKKIEKSAENIEIKVNFPQNIPEKPTESKKFQKISSKVSDFRIRTSIRSTSHMPNRKPDDPDPKDLEANTSRPEIIHPTLEFKQALPDLYKFVEHYKPVIKKNEVVTSTSGLVLISLSRNSESKKFV